MPEFEPIGTIHSPFKKSYGTPIQPAAARDTEGTVEIFPKYEEGLIDIEGFSHIILIYHFHLSVDYSLKVKPYLDDNLHGVFATRSPARPNPIGMSIVRLDKVEGRKLFIRNVDIIDGTPLLDIKPYIPAFDQQDTVKIGWLKKNVNKLFNMKDNNRFSSIVS